MVDAVDELHSGIGLLAVELEKLFRTGVQVNAYASWTGQEGFGTHWDDHDVVVWQVDGAKRWQVFGPTRRWPMHRDVEEPPVPSGPPVAEFVMNPGDVLYLPRGWWHNVRASEGVRSLHLTCGLTTKTGADLVAWLGEALRRHEVFRSDVPVFGSAEEKQSFVTTLRRLVETELAHGGAVDAFAAHHDATERLRLCPSLPHVGAVPAEPGLTVRLLTARHGIASSEDEGTVTFTGGGESWTFAAPAAPLLERLGDGRRHRLVDLVAGTGLSLPQAAAVVRELVDGNVAVLGSV